MIIWDEIRYVPDINTAHVLDGHINTCDSCEKWGEECESCNVSVPVTCDIHQRKVTMAQMTICGVPVGLPYELSAESKDKE